jgi:single-strand DNA-binding protein
MRGINQITVIGTLGQDPEVRYGKNNNTAVATISLATNEEWKDGDGVVHKHTEWHRVKLFGQLAEVAGKFLRKGKIACVLGRIRTEKYEKDGVPQQSKIILAETLELLSPRDKSDATDGDEHEAS